MREEIGVTKLKKLKIFPIFYLLDLADFELA